jgi:hypothetical protein
LGKVSKSIEQLNKEKDNTKFKPHNLAIHEYINMPSFGSDEFEEFSKHYIQNDGEKSEKYRFNLHPNIYVVFKITEPHTTYKFYPIEEFNQHNKL